MKAQIKTIILIAAVFAGHAALAESVVSKPSTRIDFNKMIEDNNNTRHDLHQGLDQDAQKDSQHVAVKKDDKAKAIDFIDVEIGVGQTPTVTDRRFDSVGEAKLATPEETQSK